MNDTDIARIVQELGHIQLIQIALIIGLAWAGMAAVDRLIPWISEHLSGRFRLFLLPSMPVLRLLIVIAAVIVLLTLVIQPTLHSLAAILGIAGVAIGFALKDYVSSVIAGIVAIYERTYRPGDWVTINGVYGEVCSMNLRALRIITPDDTVVTIPHSVIWSTGIANDTDGERQLQCAANFYLTPAHDAPQAQQALYDVALTSPYLHIFRPIAVTMAEKPGYTHYRLKAYPIDSRYQVLFISDLTARGKAVLRRLGAQPAQFAPMLAEE